MGYANYTVLEFHNPVLFIVRITYTYGLVYEFGNNFFGVFSI